MRDGSWLEQARLKRTPGNAPCRPASEFDVAGRQKMNGSDSDVCARLRKRGSGAAAWSTSSHTSPCNSRSKVCLVAVIHVVPVHVVMWRLTKPVPSIEFPCSPPGAERLFLCPDVDLTWAPAHEGRKNRTS